MPFLQSTCSWWPLMLPCPTIEEIVLECRPTNHGQIGPANRVAEGTAVMAGIAFVFAQIYQPKDLTMPLPTAKLSCVHTSIVRTTSGDVAFTNSATGTWTAALVLRISINLNAKPSGLKAEHVKSQESAFNA